MPWETLLALIGSVATNVALLGRGVFKWYTRTDDSSFRMHERGWARASELEEEVRLLRIALSRQQRRGSAHSTISEILLIAMPLPLDDRIRAVKHARELAERSLYGSEDGSAR